MAPPRTGAIFSTMPRCPVSAAGQRSSWHRLKKSVSLHIVAISDRLSSHRKLDECSSIKAYSRGAVLQGAAEQFAGFGHRQRGADFEPVRHLVGRGERAAMRAQRLDVKGGAGLRHDE